MKICYVYPYILPLCGTVVDDYQELTQQYLNRGQYCEYWNSLLRILLRKYGMPINRFFKSTMNFLIIENDAGFARSVSTWFHDSLVYKQLRNSNQFDQATTSAMLNQHLFSLITELKELNSKRKELNSIHSIHILPMITVTKHYPTIGSEKWDCGSLVKSNSIYFLGVKDLHIN